MSEIRKLSLQMLEETTAETKYTGLSMVGNFFNTKYYKQLNMVSDSRGLSKGLQRQKGIHTQYKIITIRLISLLECHAFWSMIGQHAIVALQYTCLPIEMIEVIMNGRVVI